MTTFPLWLLAFGALCAFAVAATARARARGHHLESRGAAVTAALLSLALAALGVVAFGSEPAARGVEQREREGLEVEIELEALTFAVPAKVDELNVGFAEGPAKGDGAVILLDGQGPARLFAISASGARWHLAPSAQARWFAGPPPSAAALHAACAAPTSTGGEGDALVGTVASCDMPQLAVRVDLGPATSAGATLKLTPWRGPRAAAPRARASAGALLHMDGGDAALPGLGIWNLGASGGWLLSIPKDPRRCADWNATTSAPATFANVADLGEAGCRLQRTAAPDRPGAILRARVRTPDIAGITARATLAIALTCAPALLLLLGIALARGSHRRTALLAPALRLATLAAGLGALLAWRLLLAHRIDGLRDDLTAGWRTQDNIACAVLVAATLAGLAANLLVERAGPPPLPRGVTLRRLAPLLTWSAWLGLGAFGAAAVGAPLLAAHRPWTFAALVLGSALIVAAPRAVAHGPERWLGDRASALTTTTALLALALAALAGDTWASHFVFAKLASAYGVALVGTVALRRALESGTSARQRAALLAATGAAAGAVLAYDAGVGLAITGVGLSVALLLAGHDLLYRDSAAPKLGVLEREHARVMRSYAAAGAAAALGLVAWGLVASDAWFVHHAAELLLHLPLLAAAAFALGAALARRHGHSVAAWLCAALAALALWGYREPLLRHVMAQESTSAHRVSAVLEPGYALLRDERRFLSQTSAWRAATLPSRAAARLDELDGATLPPDARWHGQGLFGARITDPGVERSIDNDYVAVLIARELGVAGLTQTTVLLLALFLGAGLLSSARLPHASAAARARLLLVVILGTLVVYQPLAALGILPLTGISLPGLGIDSPADLWLALLALLWIFSPSASGNVGVSPTRPGTDTADERVRTTPRLRRARALAAAALAVGAVAGVALVARAGQSALGRGAAHSAAPGFGDPRLDRAIAYARTLRCDGDDRSPGTLSGAPTDLATSRFHLEAAARLAGARPALLQRWTAADSAAAAECAGKLGPWRLDSPAATTCRATLDLGWPQVVVERDLAAGPLGALTCRVHLPGDAPTQLAARPAERALGPRVRVVSRAMGDAARDIAEVQLGGAIIRLRSGAPVLDASAALAQGQAYASRVDLGGAALVVDGGVVRLRGTARVFVAAPGASALARPAWREVRARDADVIGEISLIASDARHVALVRPPRAWDAPPTDATPGNAPASSASRTTTDAAVDPLLADEIVSSDGARRRTYPHGAALPQLGWVNPFGVERSLGLDGWIHAAAAAPGTAAAPSCGPLAPPAVPRGAVCSPSPFDGVMECRVSLQPELSATLDEPLLRALRGPTQATPRPATPLRAQLVLMRGDTGEILVQRDHTWGRAASAYAPRTARDELTLMRLREDRDPATGGPGTPGESDAERADWGLPVAVGSVLKPVLARATELAFPDLAPSLVLGFSGAPVQCRGRGAGHAALAGHCPPTSLAGEPAIADLHEILSRSPNWAQAALGVIGLGLGAPDRAFATGDVGQPASAVLGSDLSAWSKDAPLTVSDSDGIIVGRRSVAPAAMRRTPLWQAVEQLLGRPLCTLGDGRRCAVASARRDVCAARALPIAAPSADLRHLVALGPDSFDFYPARAGRAAAPSTYVPTREYLQWLRGSGLHPAGSLSQLTDAFSRVVYADPAGEGLAASWFPSPAVGAAPSWRCLARLAGHTATVRGADGGLCGALAEGGTAHRAIAPLFEDARVVLHGGKTGTTDSLASVARNAAACAAWNRRHTVAARPALLAEQPGWLDCGKAPLDDSLLVLAFSIEVAGQRVPLTMGVLLQRAGKGAATRLAPELVSAIADYFDPAR